VTGSIEVGKSADMVVLDKNLLEIDPTEISKTKVLMTMFEGEKVYNKL
jgi:predicted amidohydrolase YtcJ